MYNFDKIIDRSNTNSIKYEGLEDIFGKNDVMPFWVADMDFKAPDFLINKIKERAEHGIFGYTNRNSRYYELIQKWLLNRHDWEVNKEWIEYTSGVVPALSIMIRIFTDIGDKIIIQSPVYYPFGRVIEGNERKISDNKLINKDDEYFIDFDDLEEKAKDPKAKMLIMSNPHNPVGRVWKKEELERLGKICIENNVLVISDEIHFDLVYKDNKHIPFASLNESFKMNSITCTAPSKTFNIAGLHSAYCIIPNKKIREKYSKELEVLAITKSNVFSQVITEAVYEKGDKWVDELIDYLEDNMNYALDYLEKNIPEITSRKLEGTYLMWLNCKQLGFDKDSLDDFFINEAKLALDPGHWFGKEGEGYMRLNIACPRAMLKQGLDNLEKAVDKYR